MTTIALVGGEPAISLLASHLYVYDRRSRPILRTSSSGVEWSGGGGRDFCLWH